MLAFLGIAAPIVEFVGIIPYFYDIFRRKTQPERVSFWIFLLLNSITLAAQAADGWSWASVLVGMSVVTSGAIAILSLKYGYGSFKPRDAASIIIALVGVAVWLVTNRPMVAVAMAIVVDLAGFWLTLVKSWEAPHTETLVAWLAGAISTTLATIAVGKWDWVQITYVLYSAIGNWGLVILLLYRHQHVSPPVPLPRH